MTHMLCMRMGDPIETPTFLLLWTVGILIGWRNIDMLTQFPQKWNESPWENSFIRKKVPEAHIYFLFSSSQVGRYDARNFWVSTKMHILHGTRGHNSSVILCATINHYQPTRARTTAIAVSIIASCREFENLYSARSTFPALPGKLLSTPPKKSPDPVISYLRVVLVIASSLRGQIYSVLLWSSNPILYPFFYI